MPSLLDPSLLRAQAPGSDPTGIQTLLGALGSAVSGGVARPDDPNATMAALLAAGGTLAQAGAPSLGPPTTTAQAILGALGNARGAAVQTGILPYMQARAEQELESQNLDYQMKLWNFNRQLDYTRLMNKMGVSAADTGAAPAAPAAPGAAPGAVDIASLPDVQALPDETRLPAIQAMTAAGMSPAEAAHYARMIAAESGGLHIDPKTGEVKRSSAGAVGAAGVMPGTFSDMQKQYGIQGAVTDLVPNLTAGAHYFHDQVAANQGDLRNGTIAYNMGPEALQEYLAGRRVLPAETSDYLARTAPKGVQTADASGRVVTAGNAPTPPSASTGPADDPLVRDWVSKVMVPRSVLLAAQAAGLSAPSDPAAAHVAVIKDYVEKRALAPHFVPGPAPGTAINTTTGERVASPPGTATLSPLTPQERQTLFPGGMQRPVLGMRDPNGSLIDLKYPEQPEPQVPIPDAEARKPIEQGGVGDAYRQGTSYQRGAWTGAVKPVTIERGAGPPLPGASGATVMTPQQQQVAEFLGTKAQSDPRISNFQLQLGYVGRLANLAADPTRTATDDKAALAAFEKFNNPTGVLSQEGQDLVLTTGGPEQRVQTVIAKLSGGRFLTPDVVQHIVDTVNTETEGARAGFTVAANTYRNMAKARGVDPDLVTPDPDQVVKDYQEQWQQSQQRLRGGQGVGGRTAVPGAAPTERAGTAAKPSDAAQLPVPSPAALAAMSNAGLKAIVTDMGVHPDRYGPDYRSAIAAEMQKSGRR
jgi:hypothetical protein